jgi:TRAP-type C4-dicarboxylate transport system permease small subunit
LYLIVFLISLKKLAHIIFFGFILWFCVEVTKKNYFAEIIALQKQLLYLKCNKHVMHRREEQRNCKFIEIQTEYATLFSFFYFLFTYISTYLQNLFSSLVYKPILIYFTLLDTQTKYKVKYV